VGDFANAVLTFIIVALVIFLIVKVAKRYKIGWNGFIPRGIPTNADRS